MPKSNIIKKPFVTLIVVVLIAASIIFIKAQNPDLIKFNLKNANVTNKEKGSKYPRAPDFTGIEKWINSEPLKIEQLRGKVVLVDFWTYTCINCIRTLPYLKEWDKKYRSKGLVIVGVHTPEFEFEKKYENVLKAANDYQLKYPIAQDNNYATWSVYQNSYWPHEYLIDIDGYIRHDKIGEGNYDETEKMIQLLLKERMDRLNQKNGIDINISKPKEAVEVEAFNVKTPEIYLGYQFTRGNFGNPQGLKQDEIIDYKFPLGISADNVYLKGKWKNNADNMELTEDEGEILLIFNSKVVNAVAGSINGSEAVVFLDNDVENEKNKGSDVFIKENESISDIKEFKLYGLASAQNYGAHALNIKIKGKGFKLYTFTFG